MEFDRNLIICTKFSSAQPQHGATQPQFVLVYTGLFQSLILQHNYGGHVHIADGIFIVFTRNIKRQHLKFSALFSVNSRAEEK